MAPGAASGSNSSSRLPEKLQCFRCEVSKPHSAYAKNRLNSVQQTGLTLASKKVLVCISCSGAPVTELFCIGCSKRKGLDSFSHTQRNNPDHARCRVCVFKYNEALPGNMKDDSDAETDDDEDGNLVVSGSNATSSISGHTAPSTSSRQLVKARPPPTPSVVTGASGFAKVRALPRKVERPHDEDEDVEVAPSDDDSDSEYNM